MMAMFQLAWQGGFITEPTINSTEKIASYQCAERNAQLCSLLLLWQVFIQNYELEISWVK